MADSFTQKVDKFFDSNTPGGYIQTSVNISESDLDARINANISNRGFLTSTSTIPWMRITDKPSFSTVATSGNYNDLTNKPNLFSGNYSDLTNKPNIPTINISSAFNEGTKLATITINGIDTDIYTPSTIDTSGLINSESDPLFMSSPAADITVEDIANWNNKSDFDARVLSSVALSGNYSDLINKPTNTIQLFDLFESLNNNLKYLNNNTVINTSEYFSGDKSIDTWLRSLINFYITYRTKIIKIIDGNGNIYILSYIIKTDEAIYHINLLKSTVSNYGDIYNNYTNDSQLLNHITFTSTELILIYNSNLHKLYIKNIN